MTMKKLKDNYPDLYWRLQWDIGKEHEPQPEYGSY